MFDARQSLAEAQVHYQRVLLEMQLAEGSVLESRNLEITREDLRKQTSTLLARRSLPTSAFRPLLPEPNPSNTN